MIQPITQEGNRQPRSRAERARRLLTGVGIAREDSDDELGSDDLPWEWIYEDGNDTGHRTSSPVGDKFQATSSYQEIESNTPSVGATTANQRCHGRSTSKKPPARIVGAQMGGFRCGLGDCVLLKAEGVREAWVGLICSFEESVGDDDEKLAYIMWFSTEKEIRNKDKKRMDAMQNELYITPSWDPNPLTSINGKATILSPAAFETKYPNGKIPKGSPDWGKVFICRYGCNTRTATYTDEFVWEDLYQQREEDIDRLIEKVKSETKATRKRWRDAKGEQGKAGDSTTTADQDADPQTPRKKRKFGLESTPKSYRSAPTPPKFTTPSQKRFVVKKPLEFTPLGTRILSPSHTLYSPFQVARSRLHVASVPQALPCREAEFETVYSHLESAISEGSGSCIYISGTPGTGKTATVREVIAQLNASVLADELDDFVFVEINGMKVTDPHQSYSLLWEALRGERVSPAHALDLLERDFSHPGPRRVPCVVLMDELDQLVTRNQSVMYNFFNWPGLRHSRLIVLAVANTMDLPERTLSNKISSRLGLTRITFPGYTHEQLMAIIQARLQDVSGEIVDPDAVQFASRKVAAVSGDARRALDICRRAVEIAEEESRQEEDETLPATPSKLARKDRIPHYGGPQRTGKVTINTVKRAINEATTSSLQQYLRCLSLASKLFLAAVLARIRRTGVREIVMGDVMDEAKRIGQMADGPCIREFLLTESHGPPIKGNDGGRRSTKLPYHAPRVLGLAAAASELMDTGVIGLETRKGDRAGRVRLNIGEDEVKLALKDDPEAKGFGFSA